MRSKEAPLLEKQPEEYIREGFYFGSQPRAEPANPEHAARIIDLVGAESILFASDYPHWDFDHPDALAGHLERRFTTDQQRQVLSENPAHVFGIR